MSLELLPWLGLASQIAGAVMLFFSGALGLGTRRYQVRGAAAGLAFFCAGSVSLAVFALYERNFLLTGIQLLAAVLIFLGVARKAKGRRGGS
ncbi:MAG: hypothetical protein LIP28_02675 [Deltaproteobacteria bacterium]|nr:hypothetical protein [Deltaproteobacteria bacterium]